jgi:hypothetical protein
VDVDSSFGPVYLYAGVYTNAKKSDKRIAVEVCGRETLSLVDSSSFKKLLAPSSG